MDTWAMEGDNCCPLLLRAAPSQGPTHLAFCSTSCFHAGGCFTAALKRVLVKQMCSAKEKKLFLTHSARVTRAGPTSNEAGSSFPRLMAEPTSDLPGKERGIGAPWAGSVRFPRREPAELPGPAGRKPSIRLVPQPGAS